MDVVCVLNTMCMAYDKLCEKYHVYKVRLLRSLSEKCVLFAVYTSSIKYCTYDIHNYVHVLFAAEGSYGSLISLLNMCG